jgi:tetratricopeptide (TPR) repeat protein
MKKRIVYLLLMVAIVFLSVDCSRKILTGKTKTGQEKNYDTAAFNYVYVEGIKQKLMGNSGEALKYFEQCVKINPTSDAVYYQMAQILLNNGDIVNGRHYALHAYKLDDKNLWYLMLLSSLYYQEKDLDSAILYYEKAVKVYPEKEDLQLTLGNLYSENNNFIEAGQIFNNLDKKYGINESSTLSSINMSINNKKYEEALIKAKSLSEKFPEEISYKGLVANIYQYLGNNDKALEIYSELISDNPDNPKVQISFCEFLLSIKNYDELFVRLNSIVLNEAITKEEKIALFAKLIEEPELVTVNGNKLLLALMVLEATYKKDDIIPLLRPEFLIKQQELPAAASRLEEIVKDNNDNYYAWEKLLIIYLQLKDYKNLLIRGEECSSKFNRSFIAKILYATGAMETKNFEIALEELRKAEILAGDNKEYMIQVLTMRADIYYRNKDYNQAFQLYEKALKSNSQDLTLMNNYAYYLAEQNQKLKEAEEMARIVIEKEKDNTTYLDTYAWVLYKRDKINEAAKIMEKIIGSGEKPDAEWFEHYGYILKKQNNCGKAIENWNVAMNLDSTKTHLIKEVENCKR